HGSGDVAHHGHDFLLANDPWFRGLNLVDGPDGGVYVQDWPDTGECHNLKVVDQSNGRIYKVVYGNQPKPVNVNLAAASDEELVSVQLHKNDWYVRHARRLLQERAAAGKLSGNAATALTKILNENADVTRKLRALWALYGIGAKDAVATAIASDEPHIKSWGLRLMVDGEQIPEDAGQRLAEAARSDSPAVRLAVASALQRIPPTDRRAALV